jgi:HSP20 family molecular chaperone IbpA
MTKGTGLNSPLLLGFEHLERLLDHVSRATGENYPPYNIEQVGTDGLRITLAVAGFAADDLSVSIQDQQLTIRGRRRDEEASRTFLYRGIAARQFQRSFVLADGLEVTAATLDNGLLNIDLQRPKPEVQVRHIKVTQGQRSAAAPSVHPEAIPISSDT